MDLKAKSLGSDIRFWLLFFLGVRLIGITNAPLEMGHSWRQCLTLMVSRNFLENGVQFFYPMIDVAGERTGIIGSEFPFFNYLIYLVSSVFGYAHWYGRLINLLVTTVGLFYFYKLIQEVIGGKVAFFASFILCVSIWFGFGRKVMPDTFSVSLVLIGIYFGYRYLKEGEIKSILLFFIGTCLGMLCKIPALALFSVFGIVLFIKDIPLFRKCMLFGVGSLSFGIVCLWYFNWVPHLVSTYGYELYFPRSLKVGLLEILELLPELSEKFYFVAFSSFIGFGCFLGGIYVLFLDRNSQKWVIGSLTIVSVVFGLFILKTGYVFPVHSYYIVPFVPVMALVAGYLLANINARYAYIILAAVAIESIGNQHDDFFIKESEKYKLTIEQTIEEHIPVDELVVTNGTPSPQTMYLAHRKGWTETSSVVGRDSYLDSLSSLGASYLLWDRMRGEVPILNSKKVYDGTQFCIFDIRYQKNGIKKGAK